MSKDEINDDKVLKMSEMVATVLTEKEVLKMCILLLSGIFSNWKGEL